MRVRSQSWGILKHFPESRRVPISLVERKVAEFYHRDKRALIGLVLMDYFHHFLRTIPGVLIRRGSSRSICSTYFMRIENAKVFNCVRWHSDWLSVQHVDELESNGIHQSQLCRSVVTRIMKHHIWPIYFMSCISTCPLIILCLWY